MKADELWQAFSSQGKPLVGQAYPKQFLQYQKSPLPFHEFQGVYSYRHDGSEDFRFIDKEVKSVKWVILEKLQAMTRDAKKHNIVPHSDEYFGKLLDILSL